MIYYLILEDIEEKQTIFLNSSLKVKEFRETLETEQGLSKETIDYLLKNGVFINAGEEIEKIIEEKTALQTKIGDNPL